MQEYGFFWPAFSRIRTESRILSLYGKIRFRENPYSGMFYVNGDVIPIYFNFNCRENEYFFCINFMKIWANSHFFREKLLLRKMLNSLNAKSCHHIEPSQLICSASQLTGFYMMATLAFNELTKLFFLNYFIYCEF